MKLSKTILIIIVLLIIFIVINMNSTRSKKSTTSTTQAPSIYKSVKIPSPIAPSAFLGLEEIKITSVKDPKNLDVWVGLVVKIITDRNTNSYWAPKPDGSNEYMSDFTFDKPRVLKGVSVYTNNINPERFPTYVGIYSDKDYKNLIGEFHIDESINPNIHTLIKPLFTDKIYMKFQGKDPQVNIELNEVVFYAEK